MSDSDAENTIFFDTVGTKKKTPPSLSEGAMVACEENTEKSFSNIGKATLWATSGNIFWPASETCDKLTPGYYRFSSMPNVGVCLIKVKIATDNLIKLPDLATTEVLAEFSKFWTLRDRFASRGFLHKRGILLHGAPGSGKTASLMLMSEDIVRHHDGIVCQIDNPGMAASCLSMIRRIEPDRPIVALIEDLDALVDRYGENEYLALLDGETQVDRIVYVASTNYPERLDKRFVDRPSRFDTIRWIGMPSPAARRVYLETKEPSLKGRELDDWVKLTDGYSVAHLRELIILVKCFDRSLQASLKQLDSMRLRLPNSQQSPDRPAFGIIGNAGAAKGDRNEER